MTTAIERIRSIYSQGEEFDVRSVDVSIDDLHLLVKQGILGSGYTTTMAHTEREVFWLN